MRPMVVIGVPHHNGDIHVALLKSLLGLRRSSFDMGFIESANAEVATNRNIIAQKFLDHPSKPSHLFFVDSDMGIPADTVEKLLWADRSIVSGVAVQKFTNLWVSKNWGDLWDGMHTVQYDVCEKVPLTEAHWLIRPEFEDKVLRIGATGGACLLIKREVFETVPYPWFYNEYRPGVTKHETMGFMSEDISFCYKADRYGHGTYLHTGVLCDHYIGTKKFPPFWEKKP